MQAAEYAKFRPTYPGELFEYLATLPPARDLAWDCATGSGQAAVALAQHFTAVIATDASEKQILHAQPHERVRYRAAPAENSGLEPHAVDLVTVAQALHWFDLPAFHQDAQRVLKTNGVIAVWSYNLLQVNPEVDAIVNHFYDDIVGPFWPPERRVIEEGYAKLPFPFSEIEAPQFQMEVRWSLPQLLGYLHTWSATQRFIETNGTDPLSLVQEDLETAWGDRDQSVRWPLALRIGRA